MEGGSMFKKIIIDGLGSGCVPGRKTKLRQGLIFWGLIFPLVLCLGKGVADAAEEKYSEAAEVSAYRDTVSSAFSAACISLGMPECGGACGWEQDWEGHPNMGCTSPAGYVFWFAKPMDRFVNPYYRPLISRNWWNAHLYEYDLSDASLNWESYRRSVNFLGLPAKEEVQGFSNYTGPELVARGRLYFLIDRYILTVGDIYRQNTFDLRDALWQQALHLARAITLERGSHDFLGIYPELYLNPINKGWNFVYHLLIKTEEELGPDSEIEIECVLSDGVQTSSFSPGYNTSRELGEGLFGTRYTYVPESYPFTPGEESKPHSLRTEVFFGYKTALSVMNFLFPPPDEMDREMGVKVGDFGFLLPFPQSEWAFKPLDPVLMPDKNVYEMTGTGGGQAAIAVLDEIITDFDASLSLNTLSGSLPKDKDNEIPAIGTSWINLKTGETFPSKFKLQAVASRGLTAELLDDTEYYGFYVSPLGTYMIVHHAAGVATPIVDWTQSDALIPGYGTWNQLRMVRENGVLKFYGNGVLLNTIENPAFGQGIVALYASDSNDPEDPVRVQFDHLTITGTLAEPKVRLELQKEGTGSGTVTSSPAGISCGTDCMQFYKKDTVVTLSAAAATGSTFEGWGGDCSGASSCTVTMDMDRNVIATFNLSGCLSFSVSPLSQNSPAAGGTGLINVVGNPIGCGGEWTATSNATWITISSGSSGSGNGTVNYSVEANNAANSRTGTLTIAGQTFTVNQAGVSCAYSISPSSRSHGAGAETGTVDVTTQTGCNWTAASNAGWITITSGSSGSGNGTVNYSVAANTTVSSRTGTLTIAGQTFTVNQAGVSCAYSISPSSRSHGAGAETGSVDVTAQIGCNWTATSNATWIRIDSGSSGSGNGTVNYSVEADNAANSRTGTLTIAGQTFTVNQAGVSCTYSISPSSRSHGSGVETGTVSVTAQTGCNWTANSNATWIRIDSGSSGSGNGTVTYSVEANNAANSRTGTLTIANRTFTVNQEGRPAEKPNITPYQPTGWSDKIVVSKTTGTTTDSSPLYTTDTLYVNWAVCNWGPGAVPGRFYTKLYVDGIEKKSWYCDPPAGVTFHAYIKDYSIGSLSAGTHTIKTVADATGVVNESDETDNEYTKTITVITPNGPDLTGDWTAAQEICKTSKKGRSCKLSASLRVQNIGNRQAPSSYVEIYLSGVVTDTLIKRLPTGNLAPGGSKVLKVNYKLPAGESASGRDLYARIDADESVEEQDEDNNFVPHTFP